MKAGGVVDAVESTVDTVVSIHRRPVYLFLTAFLSLASLSLFVVSGNLSFFLDFVLTGGASLGRRLSALVSLYPFSGDGFTSGSGTALLAVSVLLAANVSLFVYHFTDGGSVRGGGGSAAGGFLGVLGAGCAACGSALLATVFGVSASAGLLASLPLHGVEIALLAGAVLLLVLHWTSQAVSADAACEIQESDI